MGGMFGGKAPQAQKQQPAGALNVQTSIYGSAYPLVYGKNRVPVNLIHYLNFKSIAHTTKQKTGGKGGSKPQKTTTYTYQVAMAASVGVGGLNTGIGIVWRNKEKHTLSSLGLTFFGGAAGQTAWSYLTGAAPAQAVPYANIAYIAAAAFNLGDSPSLPNLNVEFKGLCRFNPGTNDDALLSDVVVDYLTDTRHGAGFGAYLANLDTGSASFRKYCLARGLFVSPIENNQRNAGAFLKEMAELANSAMVWRNGQLHFIPYGDIAITGNGATYTPDLTPLYDLTERDFLYEKGQPPVKHSEKNPSQRFNHLRMEYNNRANDYNPSIVEVKDSADIDDNGLRTKPVRKCPHVTLASVARDIIQLEMQRDLFVSNNYAFRLGIRHSLLEPMDYVIITEPGLGLDRQLVRIIEVIEQDDAIDVVAEEVTVGVANAPIYDTVGPQGYNQDFNASAGNTQDPLIMNAPGMLTPTGYEMWINACGTNFDLWGGCEVWISDDDVSYRYVGSIMGPARYGALAANLSAGSSDYDTTSVARVQLYNGQLIGGTQEDVDDWRTLLYIGGEWMSYRDSVLVSGTTYDLDTFRRAGYGSARAAHSTGDAVAVIDEATFRLPYDAGNVGKQVYFKFPSFNVFGGSLQDLSTCVAYPHTIGASELTAPMNFADVGGNGVNILPDQYSTFESTTLPDIVFANCTAVRDASVVGVMAGSAALKLTQTSGTECYVYLGAAANIPHTKGKRYIVSLYCGSDVEPRDVQCYVAFNDGTHVDLGKVTKTTPGAIRNSRLSWVADLSAYSQSAFRVRVDNEGAVGSILWIDGLMVEEAVGLLNAPSAYCRGRVATPSFIQENAPTGGTYVNGQTWYQPSTRSVFTWNGTTWTLQADQTAAASDLFVLNPNFDQGFTNWSQVDAGFYLDSGVNALAGQSAFKFGGLSTFARLLNARTFRVRPGQVVFVSSMIGNFGSANGTAFVSLVLLDKNGNYITEKFVTFASAPIIPGSGWRNVSKKIIIPSNAATALISGGTDGHTSGYWGFDSFRAAIVEDQYAGVASGESLLPNHNFSANEGDWSTGVSSRTAGDPVTDGWYVGAEGSAFLANTIQFGIENSAVNANLRQLFIGDANAGGTTFAASSSANALVRTYTRLPVNPGEKMWVEYQGRVDQNNARPSGVNYTVYMGLWFFTKDGTSAFAYEGYSGNNVTGVLAGSVVITIPANAAYAVGLTGVIWSNTNGSPTAMPWATCHFRAQSLRVRRQFTLDDGVVTHGPTYGRTANTDLVDAAGIRRVGLNVKGSRKILGGARNARASIVAGFSSVRTATALSANSSGQISVNAHSVEISGETVTYNAVSNAVTGGSVGVTYVIYTIDPFLDGGTRTYFRQTSILSAQQAGEGAVYIGNVTIPSSGTGTGGGGGGGTDPLCVHWDSVLPDGRYVRDLALGDLVDCVDVSTGFVSREPLERISFGEEECFRLYAENGASVIQSRSTPMDLPNGQIKTTTEMFAQPVYTMLDDGQLRLSYVVDIVSLGVCKVIKPNFGGRMFLCGERADRTLATHNANAKP